MKPRKMDLDIRKIGKGTDNGEEYYDIEGIREHYPDLRFPPDKIKQMLINYGIKEAIRYEDIQELSEFDKNVMKMYRFKK